MLNFVIVLLNCVSISYIKLVRVFILSDIRVITQVSDGVITLN